MSGCSTDAVCCPPGGTPIDPEPTAPAHFPRMLRGKNSGRATIGGFTGTWVRLFLPRCTGEVGGGGFVKRAERGSATILVLVVLAGLILSGATIATLGQGQIAAVRAQTAADAAALAAAPATFRGGSPTVIAAEYAKANGALLVDCQCAVDTTWRTRRAKVTVQVPIEVFGLGRVTITRSATAEFEPVALLR